MENYLVNNLEYLYIPYKSSNSSSGGEDPDIKPCLHHCSCCAQCNHCKKNVINCCVNPEQDDSLDMNREILVLRALVRGEPRPEEDCNCEGRIEDLYIDCNEHHCDCGE